LKRISDLERFRLGTRRPKSMHQKFWAELVHGGVWSSVAFVV